MARRMRPLVLSATAAVSALGRGAAAHGAALAEGRGALRPNDFEPAVGGWIGRVEGVEAAPLPTALAAYECRNNRLAAMALADPGFAAAVAAAREAYGPGRIAVVVGTSTSGITAAEEAYRDRAADGALPPGFDYARTQDLGSLAAFVRAALGLRGPSLVVSTACASSARAFLDAAQFIEAGLCDAAVVGGADSLCRMTLQGFAALELIAPGPCRPCDAERAGISIGEAAGFSLVERADAPRRDGGGAGPRLALLGAGASSDGHHMSSPHPEGAGAVAAMRAALASAGLGPEAVDWVHLHGTGTRANDATEDMAVQAVCGAETPCSSTKGYTGHTLGACGILEVAMAGACMEQGFVPGCLGVAAPDPAFGARVVPAGRLERPVRTALSNAFGFGGVNCSLVLGTLPRP